jgi:hypothetical protein
MRTSKDIWLLLSGELIALSQDEKPPQGATVWNGYDYALQCWIFEGRRDTRSIEELRATVLF